MPRQQKNNPRRAPKPAPKPRQRPAAQRAPQPPKRRAGLTTAPREARQGVPRAMAGSSDLQRYKLALSNPFSVAADGAKVPGMYTLPTVTRRLKATFTVPVDSLGFLNALCYPHPTRTVATFANNFAGSTQATAGGPIGGTYTWVATSTGGTATAISSALASWAGFNLSSQLTNTMSTWRVAGGGVRVIPTGNYTNTQGIITVASYPLAGELLIPAAASTNVTVQSTSGSFTASDLAAVEKSPCFQIPGGTSTGMSQLDSLPDSYQASYAKLLESGGLQVVFKPAGPGCQAFRPVNSVGMTNAMGITSGQAGEAYAPGTNVSQYLFSTPQTLGCGSVDGWCGVAIYGSGMTANSNVDIEVILHIEGEPVVGSAGTVNATLTLQESGAAVAPVPTSVVETALMAVLAEDPISEIASLATKAALMAII